MSDERKSSRVAETEKKPDLLEALTKQKSDDKTARMIVKELFNSKEVDLKTHFSERETLTFAKADFFADEFENEGFVDVAEMIRDFNFFLAKKRLSYNRLSRQEFNEGLKPEMAVENRKEGGTPENLIR